MPAPSKHLTRTLETDTPMSIVNSPGSETEKTTLESPLSFYPVVLSLISIGLNSFKPAAHELTHSWINISSLFFLGKNHIVSFPLAQPSSVVFGKGSDKFKDFFDIPTNIVLILQSILQPEIFLFKSRL